MRWMSGMSNRQVEGKWGAFLLEKEGRVEVSQYEK